MWGQFCTLTPLPLWWKKANIYKRYVRNFTLHWQSSRWKACETHFEQTYVNGFWFWIESYIRVPREQNIRYIYLPKASKYLYISLDISIFLPRAGTSLYISVTIDFQISFSWYVLYSISLSAQVYVQIQSDDPLYPPHKSKSPTTVVFLHTHGYVPSCSVIPHK